MGWYTLGIILITITRRLEFDAGHRIPHHSGQCVNLHGHRYVIELTLCGQVNAHNGASDEGMLMDFGQIKTLGQQYLVDQWDHAFLVYREDYAVVDFLASLPKHKTVVLDCVPTVENLVKVAYQTLYPIFSEHFTKQLWLERVKLYETPNCWAEVSRDLSTM